METPRVAFTRPSYSRLPTDSERRRFDNFGAHFRGCWTCRRIRNEIVLCSIGHKAAEDVTDVVFVKNQRPYSLEDVKDGIDVEIEIPQYERGIWALIRACDSEVLITAPYLFNRKPAIEYISVPTDQATDSRRGTAKRSRCNHRHSGVANRANRKREHKKKLEDGLTCLTTGLGILAGTAYLLHRFN